MELLFGLLVGAIFGFFVGKNHVEEKHREINRQRWRRYAETKRAKRKAAARG